MYNAAQEKLAERMMARGCRQSVIARVVRLNPDYQEGAWCRGTRHAMTARRMMFERGLVSKARFIRDHGRDAWSRFPHQALAKEGRRKYVRAEAVVDRVWMLA